MEFATAALRRGDIKAYSAALGHGPDFARRAVEEAATLDPKAWLVVMGAGWREHDLQACARALERDEPAALADALGFNEQALRSDVLDAGGTVYARRTAGLSYHESGAAPVGLLSAALAPPLRDGLRGYEFSAWGWADGRVMRVRTGRNLYGLSNVQAVPDQALTAFPVAETKERYAEPAAALATKAKGLPLPLLGQTDWFGLEGSFVAEDGTLSTVKLGRDIKGWYLLAFAQSSLAQRLETERDRRLEVVRRLASDMVRYGGRWPRHTGEISLAPTDLADPAATSGRRGWADYDARLAATIELLQPARGADPAVACIESGPQGRRAITRDGDLAWLKP